MTKDQIESLMETACQLAYEYDDVSECHAVDMFECLVADEDPGFYADDLWHWTIKAVQCLERGLSFCEAVQQLTEEYDED